MLIESIDIQYVSRLYQSNRLLACFAFVVSLFCFSGPAKSNEIFVPYTPTVLIADQLSNSTAEPEARKMVENANAYDKQLNRIWANSKIRIHRATIVEFFANMDGSLFDVKTVSSSGSHSADVAAVKAVRALISVRNFAGEPGMNYIFRSTFDGLKVKTSYLGRRQGMVLPLRESG